MYIGMKNVLSHVDNTVCFEDNTCIKITPKQQYIITDEPKSLSEYRDLVMENVMPEVKQILEEWAESDDKAITLRLVNLMEEHDLSIAEVQKVIDLITANRVADYNKLMEEKMGDEIKQFQSDMEKYKEVCQTLSDSHKRIICLAVWRAMGTFVEDEPFEDARDNIRLSHLKQFI